MAHRLTEIDKHFELHLCAKTMEDIPFHYGLKNWTFAPNVEFHLDKLGKSSLDAHKLLATPDENSLVYVCGPQGFKQWINQTALDCGWQKEQIKQEHFSAQPTTNAAPKAFELTLKKSGRTLRVEKDETIIDALHQQNIKVPYSCLQGTCGTCVTPVVEGDIDHCDAVLSEQEKQEGKSICLCVSRSKSGPLTIDL